MSKDVTSSYIVTSPTIFIPREGLSLTVLSRDEKLVDDISLFLEKALPGTTVVVYSDYESKGDDNWPWTFQQMMVSDFIVVDCSSATQFEMMIALSQGVANNVWWMNPDDLPDNLAALLNTSGAKMAEDIEELFAIISSGL